MSPEGRERRRRAWITGAIFFAASLVLPILGWFVFPMPQIASIPRPRTPPRDEALPPAPEPTPRPTASAEIAPVSTNAPEPSDEPVSGQVLDPEGKPVEGAFVGCEDRKGDLTSRSGAEGRFRLPPDASGCTAVAQARGFGPSMKTTLRPGDGNVLRLQAPGGIAGVVVDERGQPVAKFSIGIESFVASGEGGEPGPGGRPRDVDDSSGAFAFDALEPGRYLLAVSADGRPPARSTSIDVDAGRTTRGVRITMSRGASLVGTVLDATTRAPIAGATVVLDAMTYAGVGRAQGASTNEAGVFTMPVLPNGPFSVRIEHDGHRSKIATLDARGLPTLREQFLLAPAGDGGAGLELAGIGATLAPSPKGVVVAVVFEGGPGARAGLRRGDRIDRIDGVSTEGFTVPDCVQRLRGPEGTRVTVRVDRDGPVADLTILRETFVR